MQRNIHHPASIQLPLLRGTLTLRVIVGCVSAYAALSVLSFLRVVPFRTAIAFLGLSRGGLSRGLVYQFGTSPFLHADAWHLLFNMLSLAFLGPDVERRLGRGRYALFCGLCAIAGMVGFLVLSQSHTVCIGYSGVIFGILVAHAMFSPNAIVHLYGVFPMKMRTLAILLGLVALFLTLNPTQDRVAHAAHLFGALAAYVYLRFFHSDRVPVDRARRKQAPRKPSPGKKRVVRVPDEI